MIRLLTFFALLASSLLPAQDLPVLPEPKIIRVNEKELKIGKVHLHQDTREIRFQAGVNMDKGLIEYALVTTKSDKAHEALFMTDISPFNLNLAMKLLGIKESKELFEIIDQETWTPTGKFPEVTPEQHAASLVDIFAEWKDGEKTIRKPINELIHHIDWPENTETPKPNEEVRTKEATLSIMEKGPWLSTGSYLHEGRFKAEVGGIIFGIYTNEQAIVNYFGKDRQLGDVWIPNEKVVPAVDSVVTLIVKPHSNQK